MTTDGGLTVLCRKKGQTELAKNLAHYDEIKTHGKNTFQVEVTNISGHGVWLSSGDRELFMSYEDFP